MIYLKSIYEQKIPFIEWKGGGNDLSTRAKSMFYDVLKYSIKIFYHLLLNITKYIKREINYLIYKL